jgi:hypothetical protein
MWEKWANFIGPSLGWKLGQPEAWSTRSFAVNGKAWSSVRRALIAEFLREFEIFTVDHAMLPVGFALISCAFFSRSALRSGEHVFRVAA